MRHELWFGTTDALPEGKRRHPRCSCGWHGRATRELGEMVLVWLEHVQWSELPGCRIVAEVDDEMRAALTAAAGTRDP